MLFLSSLPSLASAKYVSKKARVLSAGRNHCTASASSQKSNHIGQLLVQTTRHFQTELFRRLDEAGVDDLERLGYAERHPDPADRRAKLVRMTDSGWAAMRAGRKVIMELEAECERALGKGRWADFTATFEALLQHLDPEAEG